MRSVFQILASFAGGMVVRTKAEKETCVKAKTASESDIKGSHESNAPWIAWTSTWKLVE